MSDTHTKHCKQYNTVRLQQMDPDLINVKLYIQPIYRTNE